MLPVFSIQLIVAYFLLKQVFRDPLNKTIPYLLGVLALTPFFLKALYMRITSTPDFYLEVNCVIALLGLFLFEHPDSDSQVKTVFCAVILHFLFGQEENALLHRILFFSSLYLHAEVLTITILKHYRIQQPPVHIQTAFNKLFFSSIVCSVLADIWSGSPSFLHFVLLYAIPQGGLHQEGRPRLVTYFNPPPPLLIAYEEINEPVLGFEEGNNKNGDRKDIGAELDELFG